MGWSRTEFVDKIWQIVEPEVYLSQKQQVAREIIEAFEDDLDWDCAEGSDVYWIAYPERADWTEEDWDAFFKE